MTPSPPESDSGTTGDEPATTWWQLAGLDLAQSGLWAPVRVVAAAAHRTGLSHRTARGLTPRPARLRHGVGLLKPRTAIADSTAARTLATAAEVAQGRVEVFGVPIDVGPDPDWMAILHVPGAWPSIPSHRIALRGDMPGDPKWAWELGRHQHLVLLARAAFLEPDEPRWCEALERQLHSWLHSCPPGTGVHWAASLELALRAISWTQILALTGDRLDTKLVAEMADHLGHALVQLVVSLPATRAGMPNNHLLADTLAIDLLTRLLEPSPRLARLGRAARGMFARQLAREYELDRAGTPRRGGATIEDSVGYDRFVLELVLVRALLDRDEGRLPDSVVQTCLRHAANHLARLGALAEVPVPLFGDADEGRALVSSGPPTDLSGAPLLAAALLGSGATHGQRVEVDELAWYAEGGTPEVLAAATVDGADTGGGIARLEAAPLHAWLKGDGGGWHGHGDLGSVALSAEGSWLVAEPGTASYNPDPAIRAWAVTTATHNSLQLDGADQREPYRTFRFRHAPRGQVLEPVRLGAVRVAAVWHDAYCRLDPPRRTARLLLLDEDGLDVFDLYEGSNPENWSLTLTIPCALRVNKGALHLEAAGRSFQISLPAEAQVEVQRAPELQARWSPRYGSLEPATVVRVQGRATSSVGWAIRTDQPRWQIDGDLVTDGVHALRPRWGHDGLHVDVLARPT